MLADRKPKNCEGCYLQEQGRTNLSSISSRLYYLKELATKTDFKLYDSKENFSLKHVDLRWTNSCNQACVYCGPELSSKWAQELNQHYRSKKDSRQDVKDFVFDHIQDLQNVYLAGGEPMLMKENFEFLNLLKEKNPTCSLRVNTNLSTTKTGIFDLLCEFPNVHWTVSVETIEEEYEYVRHHGSWKDFLNNLIVINKLDHKISFNMLHFILNHESLFGCIDYLKGLGFHDNSFIAGPLYTPAHMNTLNLPEHMLQRVYKIIGDRLDGGPMGYLKNSYENLIKYYTTTKFDKNLKSFYYNLVSDVLSEVGLLGRIHAVGAIRPFSHRNTLNSNTFGYESSKFVSENFIPTELKLSYDSLVKDLMKTIDEVVSNAGDIQNIRVHGDCHSGNILWRDDNAHFVDLDDAMMAPAIQDIWMLLSGNRDRQNAQLSEIIDGYNEFFDFHPRELKLIDALRTLRIINYTAWIAKRWNDPAFPMAFPWFNTIRFWSEHILELREQFAALGEPNLKIF